MRVTKQDSYRIGGLTQIVSEVDFFLICLNKNIVLPKNQNSILFNTILVAPDPCFLMIVLQKSELNQQDL